uniref:Ral transcription factor IIIC subunit 4 n=1 Tax=Leptobrachium leishanense TaxID=445787 RepID=A0A8C5R0R5_9ANUR
MWFCFGIKESKDAFCAGVVMASPVAMAIWGPCMKRVAQRRRKMSQGGNPEAPEPVPGDSSRFPLSLSKRDPPAKLLQPSCGLQPVSWSEDHRVSVCTKGHLCILEPVYDMNGGGQDLTLHRTSLPPSSTRCHLKVGPPEEVEECKEMFARDKNLNIKHAFMLDRVFNSDNKAMPPLLGFKYANWSPMGCDVNGRCLLAALSMDNRLTINANLNRLQWKPLMDLTEKYGERLEEADYRLGESDGTSANLKDFSEFGRRYSMQTPVRMEWSGICTTQKVMDNNQCKDVGTLLLAVLFENGDIAVWQFELPVVGVESIVSCNTIESGVDCPSSLTWWEYEHSNRKMSGLIVGSRVGPVKLLPVNLKAVKGYFTLRQPVILWKEVDMLPVQTIKCLALYHPNQKCSSSLVVASRGAYVFWCLLLISKAGLVVHNSHVTGIHSMPIRSMAVDKLNGTLYTCSDDGKIRQLIPVFNDVSLTFEHQLANLSDLFGVVKCQGVAASPCGAYLACVTSEGMKNGFHPVNQNHKVNFVGLKTFEEAAKQLLETSQQNLFRQMDLTDLVRWKILQQKIIPQFLLDGLEKKMEGGSLYFWRFRLFLLRVWYQSLKVSCEVWRPNRKNPKVPRVDDPPEGREGEGQSKEAEADAGSEASKEAMEVDTGSSPEDKALQETQKKIEDVEAYLSKENMKRVLGDVYLNTGVAQNTRVPTQCICDSLSSDKNGCDPAAQVLIGYIRKKMHKQTFHEYCVLCKEILPFDDRKKTSCSNGHMWFRCSLTYQACQSLHFRCCTLNDSFAANAMPDDPVWIKKLLQSPCVFCDSPIF